MVIPRESIAEDGLSGVMGGFGYGVHYHSNLRQGDFQESCAEGLNAIFQKVAEIGEIQGFSIYRNGPKLTHLFFADDCLLFCRSTLEECEKIQELLA